MWKEKHCKKHFLIFTTILKILKRFELKKRKIKISWPTFRGKAKSLLDIFLDNFKTITKTDIVFFWYFQIFRSEQEKFHFLCLLLIITNYFLFYFKVFVYLSDWFKFDYYVKLIHKYIYWLFLSDSVLTLTVTFSKHWAVKIIKLPSSAYLPGL